MKKTLQQQFEKDKTALKYYLIGRDYKRALRMMGLVERYHTGKRRNGVPEFHHQIRICFTIIGLKGLINEEATLVATLGHDVQEDYDIDVDLLVQTGAEQASIDAIWHLTKKYRGETKSAKAYALALAGDPIGSICKGGDRVDNLEDVTDPTSFTAPKLKEYIANTEDEILPMLKQASKNFPEQHAAYGMLIAMLKRQVKTAKAVLEQRDVPQIRCVETKVIDLSKFSKVTVQHVGVRDGAGKTYVITTDTPKSSSMDELAVGQQVICIVMGNKVLAAMPIPKVSDLKIKVEPLSPILDLTKPGHKLNLLMALAKLKGTEETAACARLSELWKINLTNFGLLTPETIDSATKIFP